MLAIKGVSLMLRQWVSILLRVIWYYQLSSLRGVSKLQFQALALRQSECHSQMLVRCYYQLSYKATCWECGIFNSLHSDIIMYILHAVLYTFLMVLTRRICLAIRCFFTLWSFPLFLWPLCMIQRSCCWEKLGASHS